MKNMLQRNSKNVAIAFLVITLASVVVFSPGLMRHESSHTEDGGRVSSCESTHCSMPINDFSCFDHCMSAMQNLTQTVPTDPGTRLSWLLAAVLFLVVLFGFAYGFFTRSKFSKSRLRQFYERSVLAFLSQLGFWLSLVEKRDPSAHVFF